MRAFITGLLAGLLLVACHPKPPPDPIYPIITDAAPPPDAAPADCSVFAGRWKVVDTVTAVDGGCQPATTTMDVLTLDIIPFPEEQANEGWRGVLFTKDGLMMSGPVNQIDERPWTCRIVVEANEPPAGALFSRDFLFGEVADRGRGEATGRNGDCVWKASSLLTRD